MSPEVARIADQWHRAWAGEPWYGASVGRLLDGVRDADAASHPIAGAHSIWEQVLHMTAWREEVLQRLEGGAPGDPPAGDWPRPEPGSASAWADAVARWRAAGDALTAHLTSLTDEALDRSLPGYADRPVPGTPYQLLHGIVQHDIYHAGQIAMLRRALSG